MKRKFPDLEIWYDDDQREVRVYKTPEVPGWVQKRLVCLGTCEFRLFSMREIRAWALPRIQLLGYTPKSLHYYRNMHLGES